MKIKIFDFLTKESDKTEEEINNFIKDKKVIDIRASTGGNNGSYWHLIVILYEDIKNGRRKKKN